MLLHYFTKLSDVLLFWIAFVFTRPFGATFGDLLTKPLDHGGLNLPRGWASLVALGRARARALDLRAVCALPPGPGGDLRQEKGVF